MKHFQIIIMALSLIWFASCTTSKNLTTYTVASKTSDCYGIVRQMCMFVKEGDVQEWNLFYSRIEGFEYEEGYEYVLKVKKTTLENPPADSSSIR